MCRTLPLVLCLSAALTGAIRAQPTNVDILGDLAVKCLGEVPAAVDTFRLRSGTRMPFLRPYLTRHWLSRGYTVFLGDTTTVPEHRALHELRYNARSADVTYARVKGDSLMRTIELTMDHSFVSPDGKLIEESSCQNSSSDLIPSTDVARVQKDPWEETHGTIPIDRGWRTWVEPAVIGTSIAVVVYLFFSVRS
jgi:hypothetical protein